MADQNRPEGWIHNWEPNSDDRGSRPHIYEAQQAPDGSFHVSEDEGEDNVARTERMTRNIVTVPGRILVDLALLSAGSTTLLGFIGVFAYGAWGFWIPAILGLAGLGVTLFFAARRRQLQEAFARSGPKQVLQESSVVSRPGSKADAYADLQDMAAKEGAKIKRAREEFSSRSARFFPRIEALQRAMRQMVDPSYDAVWLQIDIRPTLAAFLGTVLVIPIGGFLIVVTAMALLLAG